MSLKRTGVRRHVRRGLVIAAVLAAGSGCERGQGPIEPTPTERLSVTDVDLTPVVAHPGESFTIAFRVPDATTARVHAHPAESHGLLHDGVAVDSLVLYDDGTHGDALAGDQWFTTDGIALPVPAAGIASVTLSRLTDLHEPGANHGTNSENAFRASFRVADPAVVGTPDLQSLSADVLATSHVVAFAGRGKSLGEAAVSDIVRDYYALFPDDRDFIVVTHPPTAGGSWSARAWQIRNDVRGIGLDVADWRDWGSPARLSLVMQSRMDIYSVREGTGSFCLVTHELTHRWAAYLGGPLADGSGHWETNALDRETSALGDSVGCIHNDLELYLAGLIPADSVATAVGTDGFTMDELVAAAGPRNPASSSAPRRFTAAFVVAYDDALSHHELAYFHHIAREYTAAESALAPNWSAATGGRSTLDPVLPE